MEEPVHVTCTANCCGRLEGALCLSSRASVCLLLAFVLGLLCLDVVVLLFLKLLTFIFLFFFFRFSLFGYFFVFSLPYNVYAVHVVSSTMTWHCIEASSLSSSVCHIPCGRRDNFCFSSSLFSFSIRFLCSCFLVFFRFLFHRMCVSCLSYPLRMQV